MGCSLIAILTKINSPATRKQFFKNTFFIISITDNSAIALNSIETVLKCGFIHPFWSDVQHSAHIIYSLPPYKS